MLDKKAGYKEMVNQINDQKAVTRQALSYVADISRSVDVEEVKENNFGATSQSYMPYKEIDRPLITPGRNSTD